MIEIVGLSKSFNGQIVLDKINLNIEPGALVVILGQSGTGKSVLLKHMIGLMKPEAGKVSIEGIDITRLTENELLLLREKIGFLFQDGALYDFMNVFENVAFPLLEHSTLSREQVGEKVLRTLQSLDLQGVETKFPSELSGGMRKRVALARAIILDTKILLCDEPTSGLDPMRSRDISDLIRKTSKRLGCTTVVTSHDVYNAMRIADQVVILNQGRIVALGSPEKIRQSSEAFVQEFISL